MQPLDSSNSGAILGILSEKHLGFWEAYWTRPNKRWGNKPLPNWVLWLSPDLSLKPNERYRLRLYITMVVRPLLFALSCLALSYYYGTMNFWKDPTIKLFKASFKARIRVVMPKLL